MGPPEVYGDDRLFVAIGEPAAVDVLEAAGQPVVRLPYTAPAQIGGEFFRWEFATAVAGYLLGIDPFDQPNVQEAKDATARILEKGWERRRRRHRRRRASSTSCGTSARGTTSRSRPTCRARARQRRSSRRCAAPCAIPWAWRPRLDSVPGSSTRLGSTIRAAVITGSSFRSSRRTGPTWLSPGNRTRFGQLSAAQAQGDLESLRAHDRRVARVTRDQLLEVGK